MPEGPIIAILKENAEQFTGKTIIAASNDNGIIDADLLKGQTITAFKGFGKNFFICFADFNVRIHLMMFGSYLVNTHKTVSPRLGLKFDDGTELNFYTCVVELIITPLDDVYDWTADVMSPDWDAAKAIQKMKDAPNMLACDVLMDQHIFAGVGNIIKNEVLFRTRIHPKSLTGKLPDDKLKELTAEAVNYSFDFLRWKKEGNFNSHWLAYEQKICPRDKVPFHKAEIGKARRGTYYCDLCMVLYG